MRLYSTLSRAEEEFVPACDRVKMYVCGITPYAPSHVGHALSSVVFDVLRRYLEFQGHAVHHVQNFTDVDDKIIARSAQEKVSYRELADRYIEEYTADLARLRVMPAHAYPLATESIPTMLEIIGQLVDKGYAYESGGDVYFRVGGYDGYGKLSRRSIESMIAGARVEALKGKEHPMDFTLWKAAKPEEPSWKSPWGAGRPGWHIECSAIALDHLGKSLDIHGGGQDLVFPHHENEIAQSEAYTGTVPFARFWVHNGLVNMGEDKMSKSLGNLVRVSEALERHSVDALRLYFLSSHYRSPLNYSEEGLAAMERAVTRLRNAFREGPDAGEGDLDPTPYEKNFIAAMDADLNTPQAMAALFDLAHEINRAREKRQGVAHAQARLRTLGGVLGLVLEEAAGQDDLPLDSLIDLFKDVGSNLNASGQHKLAGWVNSHDGERDGATIVETLLAIRRELRQAREYGLADSIRSRLAAVGISLEDAAEGTVWRHREPSA